MSRNLALVDLDGTLADFELGLSLKMLSLISPTEVQNPLEVYRTSWFQARKHLICNQQGFWSNLPKIETGFKFVAFLKLLGYEIQVLTKAPHYAINAWSEKAEWVKKHLPGVPVTVTEDKSITQAKVLFDDWVPYVEPWLEANPTSQAVLLEQPWNIGFQHPRATIIKKGQENFSDLEERLKL